MRGDECGVMELSAEAPNAVNRVWIPTCTCTVLARSFSPTRKHKQKQYSQLTCGDIGLLTGPHQMSFLELSSSTIRLSSGERPVLAPEYAVKAPVDVMAEPVS